jgi:hypothetical protein
MKVNAGVIILFFLVVSLAQWILATNVCALLADEPLPRHYVVATATTIVDPLTGREEESAWLEYRPGKA